MRSLALTAQRRLFRSVGLPPTEAICVRAIPGAQKPVRLFSIHHRVRIDYHNPSRIITFVTLFLFGNLFFLFTFSSPPPAAQHASIRRLSLRYAVDETLRPAALNRALLHSRHLYEPCHDLRSLSPSSITASPTNRRPSYGSQLLSVPGSAPGVADAPFDPSFVVASPGSTSSRHRRGSRSSILASASEAAASPTSDRESIRSVGSSSRAGPSTPRQKARRPSRNEEGERNASPVSFYSSFEAPLTSPRQSRRGSNILRSPSPTASAAAHISYNNGSSHVQSSKAGHAPFSDASRAALKPSTDATPTKLSASARHDGAADRSSSSSRAMRTLSAHSVQLAANNHDPPAADACSRQSRTDSGSAAGNSLSAKPKSISVSRSANALPQLDQSLAIRSRSKSSTSSSKPPNLPNALDTNETTAPSNQSVKTLAPVPSKLSLRSRIFGSRSTNSASPTKSSFDLGQQSPSPRSAQFSPSIRSESSYSDNNPSDALDSRSIQRAQSQERYAASSSAHGRDDDDDSGELANGDSHLNATSSRKSSGASSFLRKTMRFKDRPAFLKPRPSVSSMNSDSAASTSTSVPPSPLDPPTNSDTEDAARFAPLYKQVSGRRGLQYRQPALDQPTDSDSTSHVNRSPSISTRGDQDKDAIALLPAVTERDLEGSSKLRRSLSLSHSASSLRHDTSSPAVTPDPSEPGPISQNAATSQQVAASPLEAGARSHIPRSSSLHGYAGRSSSSSIPVSQTISDHTASPPLSQADVPALPRRRPRSGSASAFAPQIQPRTTSSPKQSSGYRPLTASGGPSPAASPYVGSSSISRPTQRAIRPKTAESGHTYSDSLSSLRDILMVAHAISEEGAVYHTPEKTQMPRFESSSDLSIASKATASPGDPRRPGLPPKNPLRKQRPSAASIASTPSVSGHSPASVHTTGVFTGPSMAKAADAGLLRSTSRDAASKRPIPVSASTPSLTEFQTPTSDVARVSPADRQATGDYFLSREIPRNAPLSHVPSRSPGLTHDNRSGSSSPAQTSFTSTRQLSRAPSTDSAVGWVQRRHERSASDATNSFTDLRAPLGMGASTPSLHSETSSGTKKKKEGPGSKIFAFARDLTHREGSNDQTVTLSSSATFRLGKSSKSKKADASSRPVIRRLYDGPLETEASASSSSQSAAVAANGPHSPLQYSDGVSPGTSVADLQGASASARSVSGTSATPDTSGRHAGSANMARSVSSSGGTARDLLSPAPAQLLTPQFGNISSGSFIPRSPSFAGPSWSIPQEDLTQEQKRLAKRWFVLRELLDTEKAYASDLAVARDIYLARAKMRAGITAPLSPLSVRSASVLSQLASPEPSTRSRSSQPHLQQQRGSASVLSPGSNVASGRISLPQRALFRNASADGAASASLASPSSANQGASSTSVASSNPSNRSSMFTVSSQSSQTSETTQFTLPAHPTLAGGLPSPFSIDVNTHSSASGKTSVADTPTAVPTSSFSPLSSTSATPSISTPSGILSPSFVGPSEAFPAGLPDAPLSASDVRIIFAQLESCAAFADEMVVILEGAVGKVCSGTAEEAIELLAQGKAIEEAETDRVGQAFLKLMPRIEQVYSAYCSRHEASMSRLQELLNTQPKASAFLSECTQAARAFTNAWDLSSLLIKPVQRVLKYPLLLAQISASTSSKHPDSESLSAASVEIQKVADNINEVKKRKDLVEQIVSGKTTKRSTSQRIQHGATKKLLRRQEKVKQLVLGLAEDDLADEAQYKALVNQFQQLEKATITFARRSTTWSSNVKDAHAAQLRLLDQWCRAYAVDDVAAGTEAEHRLRAFAQLVEGTFLGELWTQLDTEIRSSLTPAVQRIASLFLLPQSVIAKRDDREPDYTRYKAEIARGGAKAVDKKLTESATAFVALHTQLMNELPQFNYGVQTLLDLSIESLSRTQASYHLHVHRALIGFWQNHGPDGNADVAHNEETDEKSMRHLHPVKMFWPLHSSIAGFAESLGIVGGVVEERDSRSTSISRDSELLAVGTLSPASTTHFSPLQTSRTLPDPDFASQVPNATSMSQQVESITAAGSEELLDTISPQTISPRTSPNPYRTPPLGSRRGSSRSPQLRSQSLLGSPAPIGPVPLAGGPQQQQSTIRASKSGGGLIGLLRSVGSSSAVGSRKTSQSTDTAPEGYFDGLSSDPPTPISKDTPLAADSPTAGEPVAPPTLPALTFNSGFFGQSGSVFDSASAHGLGVKLGDAGVAQLSSSDTANGSASPTPATSTSPSKSKLVGTMAAVANSASAESRGTAKNGYPFIEYATGDLFTVVEHDDVHLFGHSEHGVAGWVERENFVPLA